MWAKLIATLFIAMTITACSLQLPGGPVEKEPFFRSTYVDEK